MQTGTILSAPYPRYHSEFRILFASTSADPASERELLFNIVLPEIRREARERGVLVVEYDPRLEVSMAPGRAEEIEATRLDEMNGHRPVFIGVLGAPATQVRSDMPWLRDMGDAEGALLGMSFMKSAMENPLMRDRSFFYIPGSYSQPDEKKIPQQLQALRARARNSGCQVHDGIATPDELGKLMLADLLAALDQLYPGAGTLSLLERWRRSNEIFAAPLRRAYVELPGHFDRLDAHIAGDGSPLFITGGSGAGKSALLANWVAYRRDASSAIPIISHHIGARPVESNHTAVLRHLLMELKELLGIDEPIPERAEELTITFPLWLEQAGEQKIILVIDGLDHLDVASHSLDWLSADIPPNIRLILSTAQDDGDASEIIGHLIDRDWQAHHLPPLTLEEQRKIIREMMSTDSGNKIDPDLLGRFTIGGAVSNPLFLRMGVRQLQKTPGGTERDRLLATRTQDEFFTTMFDQLENEHGSLLVTGVMSYIWGSRAGMRKTELKVLAGTDDEALTDLLATTDHYLANREEIFSFLHPYISTAVQKRYLPKPAAQRRIHKELAEYFASEPLDIRRADEEPWQWKHAGERKRLAECLADIGMFEHLATEDRRHELREYWVWIDDEQLMISFYDASFAAWCSRISDIEKQADIADRLGVFFMGSGLFAAAKRYLELALQLHGQHHGDSSIQIACTAHHLAELLRQDGKFAEAEERYRAALAILEEQAESDLPSIAQILSDLGLLYRDSGRHQLALPYYKRAVELKEQAWGAEHPSTAESLNDLALLYHDLRDFDMALPLYRRAQEISERRLGPNHPATAISLNNMAGAYREAGHPDQAEKLYHRALAIREKMLGYEHPHTLITFTNIASFLQSQGQLEKSRELFERVIASTMERLGEMHPSVISLRTSYAYLQRDLGDIASAERELRQTLELARQSIGDYHPSTATCANNLAVLLRKMGRNDEAEPFYKMAIIAWQNSLGPEHPYVADALESLGNIHFGQNAITEAKADAERSLLIRTKVLGPDHALTQRVRVLLEKISRER